MMEWNDGTEIGRGSAQGWMIFDMGAEKSGGKRQDTTRPDGSETRPVLTLGMSVSRLRHERGSGICGMRGGWMNEDQGDGADPNVLSQ